jgi:hypothetical protein
MDYLPPPWIEGVGVVVDVAVEVDRSEVEEDTPPLGNEELPLHLDVLHCLAHDPVYDVANP